MKLAQLLEGVKVAKLFQTMFGRMVVTHDVEVHRIQYDSRKIEQGDCFVAIRGTGSDGHQFIGNAVSKGAKVVVMENDGFLPDSFFMHAGVVKAIVSDSRKAMATMAANFFGHPSKKMKLVGVTGTNGKTTTSSIIQAILEAAGNKTGLIGTIEYRIGNNVIPATHTTPESLELNELLARMVETGCTSVSMEVSSHALHQSRVYGLEYAAAVFTNLTQDHLDYHNTMEEYFQAKKILFDGLTASSWGVTNADDNWGTKILASTTAKKLTYGVTSSADIRATDIQLSINGTSFAVQHEGKTTMIHSSLVGRFNVYNILAAFSAGVGLGIPKEIIRDGIENIKSVRGRFERIASPKGWTAIIDYAHTPDALEKCLTTIHDVLPKENRGKIITVFGAGGDRDKKKRPMMGEVAGRLSDVVIVTSDNPRTEDPQAIINDVVKGVPQRVRFVQEVDRRKAIEKAIAQASAGDVVLVAGKGHEDYQVIGTEKIHFSDREAVEKLL
ncbi:MAG: UDP-N-acetylmuramoyl-L-alanyl-D-glutamate--2,6-diaminopimelate ligase [Ignavibacteriales bacterium]|nr:UDP-N-acetylmuramoyl-L-alanyl-D-glutamate--2,6-diaminopimelate ligase [Ignavibacteriales bacterium]